MRVQAKDTSQVAYLDDGDSGEGLSIFVSQSETDTIRWRLDVSASLDNGSELAVGTFYLSPPSAALPNDRLTRLVAIAVCPGAVKWSVTCTAISPGSNETINIELASSKCCTAPCGLSRVSERYDYIAGSGTTAVFLVPGQTVTRINLFGLGGGGTASIQGGPNIPVAAAQSVTLEPKGLLDVSLTGSTISITNLGFSIEYLESA